MMNRFHRIPAVVCVALALTGAALAQHAPPELVNQLLHAAGTLRGEGQNAKATGPLGLKSYRVHELTLPEPVTVTIGGKAVTTNKAWRLTVTGGPFAVRAVPATIEIDGVAAGVALESADRSELRMVTFDASALHQGAAVAVAYGDLRFNLPETLNLNH